MDEKGQFKLPAWAILLDVAGTLFLAVGLFALYAGEKVMPNPPVDLRGYAITLIILGVLLMVPLIVVLVQRGISAK